MVHLQLALLVDHDYYLNVFLFEQKNLVDRDVVLKRKVHWLYTLVDPSKYVLDCSCEKYSKKYFSLSLQKQWEFIFTCFDSPQGSGRIQAFWCGSLSWAFET